MCLTGAVVASFSVTQQVGGSRPFNVITNIFVIEFTEFRENSNELKLNNLECKHVSRDWII